MIHEQEINNGFHKWLRFIELEYVYTIKIHIYSMKETCCPFFQSFPDKENSDYALFKKKDFSNCIMK